MLFSVHGDRGISVRLGVHGRRIASGHRTRRRYPALTAVQRSDDGTRLFDLQRRLCTVQSHGVSIFTVVYGHPLSRERPARAPGAERIDPLRFLTGCRKRRLNQALIVLSA